MVCIQGPLQSLAWIQRVTHFNNWVIGHAHIAVLGFTGLHRPGGDVLRTALRLGAKSIQ